jgi:aryl-alcohol dehydrogenase-like predicted oxidoreductase
MTLRLKLSSACGRSPRGQALSVTELALAWVLRRPEIASAIVGASRPEQVHANANASGIELTLDILAAIDEALGDAPIKEPTLAPMARPGVTHR